MSSSRLDSYLLSFISSLYLLLLFFLPLLFSMKSSEVFEFPKMLFVYAMTVLIVSCWIARMIVNRKFIYTRTPLDIPIFLFLLSQFLSTLFSIDLRTSIFGFYSRWNGGLLSTIAYSLLFLAYVNNQRAEKGLTYKGQTFFSLHPLIGCSVLGSAAIVSLYAILQRLSIDKHLWVQDVVNRVFSTQGQPNWLAEYLVMVTPLAFVKAMSNEQKVMSNEKIKRKLPISYLSSIISYFLLIIFFLSLAFSRSRSGLLGLAVADAVFWGLLFLKRSDLAVRRGQTFRSSRLWRPFLIVHCSLLIVFLLTNNPAREWISRRIQYSSSQTTNDELRTMNTVTDSGDIRRIVWTGAVELIKQRPLFGWGPETFAYTYWRVRPAAHNLTSEWNFLYNKAHNEWLNLAANTGLIGLGTHLLLLGWFTVWTAKTLQAFVPRSSGRGATGYRPSSRGPQAEGLQVTRENQRELVTCRLLLVATISALWGTEIVNVFGFSTVTTQTYSYIFMGIAAVGISKIKDQKSKMANLESDSRTTNHESRKTPLFVAHLLSLGMMGVMTLYLLTQILFLFLADLPYNRGRQLANTGYVAEALEPAQQAVYLMPEEPVFRSELAATQGVLALSVSAASIDASVSTETLTTIMNLKDSSLANFMIVEAQSPANLSFLRARAKITYALGALDAPLYEQGIFLMQRAMELAPTDPKIPYSLGVMFRDLGRSDEARKTFQKALDLKPDYEEAKKALTDNGNFE